MPRPPIQRFHLIGEDGPRDGKLWRKDDLERIPFDLAGDGTQDGKPHPAVVAGRREDDGGATPRLLMPGLGLERNPEACPTVVNGLRCGHQALGMAQSVSHPRRI